MYQIIRGEYPEAKTKGGVPIEIDTHSQLNLLQSIPEEDAVALLQKVINGDLDPNKIREQSRVLLAAEHLRIEITQRTSISCGTQKNPPSPAGKMCTKFKNRPSKSAGGGQILLRSHARNASRRERAVSERYMSDIVCSKNSSTSYLRRIIVL